MESKFNFYDFVGYIIPGAIFVLVLYWLINGFFGITIKLGNIEFLSTIFYISISYFVGHLLQGVGSFFTNRKNTTKEGLISTRKYSRDFLKNGNDFYSNEQKKAIKKRIQEVFEIDLDSENVQDKQFSEAFNLCYTLIIQEDIGIHTEIFNGFYSFFRGLKIVSIFGILVNFLIVIEQLLLHFCPVIKIISVTFQSSTFIISILLFIFFTISYFISKFRCDDFSKHFANSVYRSFLVYCIKNKPSNR